MKIIYHLRESEEGNSKLLYYKAINPPLLEYEEYMIH